MVDTVLTDSPIRTHPHGHNRKQNIHTTETLACPTLFDLESEADALLGRLLVFSHTSGVYSDRHLNRKMRDEQKYLPESVEYGVSDETIEYLVQAQVNDLVDAANLNAIQEIIYRLYVSGVGVGYIAAALGRNKRTIRERLKIIKLKVRAAYREGRYAGWYEVYLSEVKRGG